MGQGHPGWPNPSPNPDDAGPIVRRLMGLPVAAGCDTAWDRTRIFKRNIHQFNRLLLLLLCVVSSEVPNVQTRPINFVCDANARRNMNNMKDLEVAMVGCSGSDQLPSSLQLPCISILKASWDHKSLQQKRAEVRGALGVLLDGVGRVRTQTKLSCQSSLLERLEHRITNYLHIVTNLDIKGDLTDPDPSCPSQQSRSLTQVLQIYGRLLWGKLEWLSLDLRDRCLDQR